MSHRKENKQFLGEPTDFCTSVLTEQRDNDFLTGIFLFVYVFEARSLSTKSSNDRVNRIIFVGVTRERNSEK